jgi:hypothetical protein
MLLLAYSTRKAALLGLCERTDCRLFFWAVLAVYCGNTRRNGNLWRRKGVILNKGYAITGCSKRIA